MRVAQSATRCDFFNHPHKLWFLFFLKCLVTFFCGFLALGDGERAREGAHARARNRQPGLATESEWRM
jgi:hypothetical protein